MRTVSGWLACLALLMMVVGVRQAGEQGGQSMHCVGVLGVARFKGGWRLQGRTVSTAGWRP